MKLIVGLGNPGEKYQSNRHNVGFMFVDYLVSKLPDASWKYDKYLLSEVAKAGPQLVLAKPQTFMNKSGEAVRRLIDNLNCKTDDLLVVHDDLDIPLGKFRIVRGYGPKLHNGLESIEQHLHTQDYLRVRIGVDNRQPENRMPGIEYVLQDFTEDEKKTVSTVYPSILKLFELEYDIHILP